MSTRSCECQTNFTQWINMALKSTHPNLRWSPEGLRLMNRMVQYICGSLIGGARMNNTEINSTVLMKLVTDMFPRQLAIHAKAEGAKAVMQHASGLLHFQVPKGRKETTVGKKPVTKPLKSKKPSPKKQLKSGGRKPRSLKPRKKLAVKIRKKPAFRRKVRRPIARKGLRKKVGISQKKIRSGKRVTPKKTKAILSGRVKKKSIRKKVTIVRLTRIKAKGKIGMIKSATKRKQTSRRRTKPSRLSKSARAKGRSSSGRRKVRQSFRRKIRKRPSKKATKIVSGSKIPRRAARRKVTSGKKMPRRIARRKVTSGRKAPRRIAPKKVASGRKPPKEKSKISKKKMHRQLPRRKVEILPGKKVAGKKISKRKQQRKISGKQLRKPRSKGRKKLSIKRRSKKAPPKRKIQSVSSKRRQRPSKRKLAKETIQREKLDKEMVKQKTAPKTVVREKKEIPDFTAGIGKIRNLIFPGLTLSKEALGTINAMTQEAFKTITEVPEGAEVNAAKISKIVDSKFPGMLGQMAQAEGERMIALHSSGFIKFIVPKATKKKEVTQKSTGKKPKSKGVSQKPTTPSTEITEKKETTPGKMVVKRAPTRKRKIKSTKSRQIKRQKTSGKKVGRKRISGKQSARRRVKKGGKLTAPAKETITADEDKKISKKKVVSGVTKRKVGKRTRPESAVRAAKQRKTVSVKRKKATPRPAKRTRKRPVSRTAPRTGSRKPKMARKVIADRGKTRKLRKRPLSTARKRITTPQTRALKSTQRPQQKKTRLAHRAKTRKLRKMPRSAARKRVTTPKTRAVKSIQKPRQEKPKTEKSPNFVNAIKLLATFSPTNLTVPNESAKFISDMMITVCKRIIDQAVSIARKNNTKGLSSLEAQRAVQEVFPQLLAEHAMAEGAKCVFKKSLETA